MDGEGTFRSDAWVRESGGGGISRVVTGGKVFEKAGVNLSVVYGTMPQEALKAANDRGFDRAKGRARAIYYINFVTLFLIASNSISRREFL